jgi:transitional endoplasmic reticulum ATPase
LRVGTDLALIKVATETKTQDKLPTLFGDMKHDFKQPQHRSEGTTDDAFKQLFDEALAYEKLYSFADACRVYGQIVERWPQDHAVLTRLMHCLMLDGRNSAAAVRAESIIAISPSKVAVAEAYLVLARVTAGEGEKQQAAEYFMRARSLDESVSDPSLERDIAGELSGDESEISVKMKWQQSFTQSGSWSRSGDESPFELTRNDEDDEDAIARKNYVDNGFFDAMANGLSAEGLTIANFEQPEISFRDIGGYREIKEKLRLQFFYPMRHEGLFGEYGQGMGGSVLLYGPYGCGKTMLARAVASEVERPLITVSAQQILEAEGGAGERLRHYFDLARTQLPAILFFDNAECLLDGSDTGGLRSQFLEELDNLESERNQLLVIFASNEPWRIDPIFRRSGRFHQSILVGPPEKSERSEIIRVLGRTMPIVEFDAAKIAAKTDGFTGSELKAMFDAAARLALLDALRNRGETVSLTTKSLIESSRHIRPASEMWFERLREHLKGASLRKGEDILAHLR